MSQMQAVVCCPSHSEYGSSYKAGNIVSWRVWVVAHVPWPLQLHFARSQAWPSKPAKHRHSPYRTQLYQKSRLVRLGNKKQGNTKNLPRHDRIFLDWSTLPTGGPYSSHKPFPPKSGLKDRFLMDRVLNKIILKNFAALT